MIVLFGSLALLFLTPDPLVVALPPGVETPEPLAPDTVPELELAPPLVPLALPPEDPDPPPPPPPDCANARLAKPTASVAATANAVIPRMALS